MPMPVTFTATEIEGVLQVETGLFRDQRGYFSESYSRDVWAAAGFQEAFLQDNLSLSAKGTLRGLHYQIEPASMGKLVRCLRGAIFDVAVDLRQGSPSFGKWVGRELNDENNLALWIPAGFAHGFLALSDGALVHYKCSNHHAPEYERALAWNDPQVAIAWPAQPAIISEKDAAAPTLEAAEYNFIYSA
jgi:dTDP-4-dehydrorhamnose 3,5-epimerase